ncbi:gfa-like protein [alpha proteobacterium U9-1i]|nr:gfa-like protein [alpha proteobacterium U9-1i]
MRYALYVAPQNAHVCHCRMCQKATGGLFAALAGAPKAEFAWTQGEPAVFASSNLATRTYCPDCGTPLSFAYNLPEARFYVTMGSLDAPEDYPIVMQYGVESRLPWVRFCEDVKSETTGEDPKAAEFFKKLESNQK